MKKYAFLDFDGTLYNGFSINDFVKFAAKKFGYDWALTKEREIVGAYLAGKISYEKGTGEIHKLMGDTLKGKSVTEAGDLAKEFWVEHTNQIYPWAYGLVQLLKDKGFSTYIVSASVSINIEEAVTLLGVDGCLSSETEEVNGVYTGKPLKILYSNVKEKEILKVIENISPPPFKIGIGDSIGDLGMFLLMDRCFIVNAHHQDILTLAKKNGWNVVKDGNKLLNELKNLP